MSESNSSIKLGNYQDIIDSENSEDNYAYDPDSIGLIGSVLEKKHKIVQDLQKLPEPVTSSKNYCGRLFIQPLHYTRFLKFIFVNKLYSLTERTVKLSDIEMEKAMNFIYYKLTDGGREKFLFNIPLFLAKHMEQVVKDLENWINYGIGPIIDPDVRIRNAYIENIADIMINTQTMKKQTVDFIENKTKIIGINEYKNIILKEMHGEKFSAQNLSRFQSVIQTYKNELINVLKKKLISKLGIEGAMIYMNLNNNPTPSLPLMNVEKRLKSSHQEDTKQSLSLLRDEEKLESSHQKAPIRGTVNQLWNHIADEIIQRFSVNELYNYITGKSGCLTDGQCKNVAESLLLTKGQVNDITKSNKNEFVIKLQERLKSSNFEKYKAINITSKNEVLVKEVAKQKPTKLHASTISKSHEIPTSTKKKEPEHKISRFIQNDQTLQLSSEVIIIDDDNKLEINMMKNITKAEKNEEIAANDNDITNEIFNALMNTKSSEKWTENKDKHLIKFILKTSGNLQCDLTYDKLLKESPDIFQGVTSKMLKNRTNSLAKVKNYFYLSKLCGSDKIQNKKQKHMFFERIEFLRKLMRFVPKVELHD